MGYEHFRYARRIDADSIGLYHNDMTRILELDKGGVSNNVIRGQTGKGLYLYATPTGSGYYYVSSTGAIIVSATANQDLSLLASGTGRVKFGTHTATGDAVSNGSIEIKDSGGATRKLMTKA